MTHNAHAHSLNDRHAEIEPVSRPLRLLASPPSAAGHVELVVSAEEAQAVTAPGRRAPLQAFWHWLLRPPIIDATAAADFGVLKAMLEVGSDYLPSSGTWPGPL